MRVLFNGLRYMGDLLPNTTLILYCHRAGDYVQIGKVIYTFQDLGYYRLYMSNNRVQLKYLEREYGR